QSSIVSFRAIEGQNHLNPITESMHFYEGLAFARSRSDLGKRRIWWLVLAVGLWRGRAAGFGSNAPERATGRMPVVLFARFTTPVMRLRCGLPQRTVKKC